MSEVDRYIAERVGMVIDNEEGLYREFKSIVDEAVNEVATELNEDDPQSAFSLALSTGNDRARFVNVVGEHVSVGIRERITDDGSLETRLLGEIMDHRSRGFQQTLGEHYLPESVDDVEWSR